MSATGGWASLAAVSVTLQHQTLQAMTGSLHGIDVNAGKE